MVVVVGVVCAEPLRQPLPSPTHACSLPPPLPATAREEAAQWARPSLAPSLSPHPWNLQRVSSPSMPWPGSSSLLVPSGGSSKRWGGGRWWCPQLSPFVSLQVSPFSLSFPFG